VLVTFGRDVTDEDLRKLQTTADVLAARSQPIDIDSDHVHNIT
jgi:hypothetical protein